MLEDCFGTVGRWELLAELWFLLGYAPWLESHACPVRSAADTSLACVRC